MKNDSFGSSLYKDTLNKLWNALLLYVNHCEFVISVIATNK